MVIIISFTIGVVIGGAIIKIISILTSFGNLRLDESDPNEQPYLFLEIKKDPKKLNKRKFVTLKVSIKDFIPRK